MDWEPSLSIKKCLPGHTRLIFWLLGLMGCLYLTNSYIVSLIQYMVPQYGAAQKKISDLSKDEKFQSLAERSQILMYSRLLDMASLALAADQNRGDSFRLWEEPYEKAASAWKPCADKHDNLRKSNGTNSNGYILVSANGGLNQQRVAVCNAVAVASLLNATLVIPKFLYSPVWKDTSQFGDIYQEDHFMSVLKHDLNIAKELPSHLKNLDLEAIGSLITDENIMKEAKPLDFVKKVLPIIQRNGIVHFLGFGNRLASDPVPFALQKLRCKCNFHALKFVPKVQKVGSLLVQRIRNYSASKSMLDKKILGRFMPSIPLELHDKARNSYKYLALHLRFEMDMVAYSMCDFGGGQTEMKELQAYRELNFPLLLARMRDTKILSPAELRELGRCPLTPEEAALILSALGYKRDTYIYLAGSRIYGGQSSLSPFTNLYHNLVTKENLLTKDEIAPFRNFSSQMAALDFIACATADVFAMTDTGSQFSTLVAGYRTYYGAGRAPTLRPNKKRFAKTLSKNGTIEWREFKDKVRKMIEEGQRVQARSVGRSIYRRPRCPECMCKS